MPITMNDCLTNADLPPLAGSDADAPGAGGTRRRRCIIDAQEADQMVAAFLASGHLIKTYPAAYAVKSPQYHWAEPHAAT